jgi:pSer/pThr/pTyr-binding forkhead associated (FHA) protein
VQVKLIPLDHGNEIDLTREITIIGRQQDCDARLEQKSVSKQHCVLVKSHGIVMLRDLGSTNGTYVNGQRVRRAALVADDSVTFANVKYQLVQPKAAPPAPTVGIDTRTQQMRPEDLEQIMGRLTQTNIPDLDAEPRVQIKTGELPDRYEE